MSDRVPALLTVLAGSFDNQLEAFAALREASGRHGATVTIKEVDVIREASNVRLAHYFRPQIVARIQTLQGDDDTVIVLRPSTVSADPGFPGKDGRLRRLGLFAGEIVETPDPDDVP